MMAEVHPSVVVTGNKIGGLTNERALVVCGRYLEIGDSLPVASV
jgi:hypothetical protein